MGCDGLSPNQPPEFQGQEVMGLMAAQAVLVGLADGAMALHPSPSLLWKGSHPVCGQWSVEGVLGPLCSSPHRLKAKTTFSWPTL